MRFSVNEKNAKGKKVQKEQKKSPFVLLISFMFPQPARSRTLLPVFDGVNICRSNLVIKSHLTIILCKFDKSRKIC